MFTRKLLQVCNHSVLISSLGMGFGHRNCVVVGCPNSGKRLNKWAKQTCTVHACLNGTHTCDCEPPFKLFPFPTEKKDSEGRRRWTENIKREIRKGKVWTPKNSSRVCSVHFKDGRPTNENPDPTEDLGYNLNSKVVGGKRKSPLDRSKIIPEKKPRKAKKSGEEVSEVLVEQEIPNHSDTCVSENTATAPETTANSGNCSTVPEAEFFVNNCCPEKDLRIQELQEQLKKAENELTILKEKLKKIRERKGLKCGDLKTDKEVNLLTGIPTRAAFDALFDMVKKNVKKLRYWTGPVKSTRKGRNFKKSPKKFGPKRELTEKDEFLLTMMKLRLGSTNADLAQRFAVSATTVTNVFTTWVKLLASELGCLIYNPSYEVFRKTLPKKFHKPGYSKVRHIIDCTEVFIETPSDPALKAATWSDYKHHHTTKILLSITPNGAFNFVSKAWGGRTSDVHVTRESGFYDILEQHDEVMADRGFTIAEDLLLQHAKLHIPPGKRGQEQFSKSEVKKTKVIANLRIYVEQAIRRLKTFRLIKNELPISMLSNLDNIITVCAAICNLYKPLCKP